jgi:hypothetical protein
VAAEVEALGEAVLPEEALVEAAVEVGRWFWLSLEAVKILGFL